MVVDNYVKLIEYSTTTIFPSEDTLYDDSQGTVGSTAEAVASMKAEYPSKTHDSSKEKKVFPVTDDGHKVGSQSMNSKAEAASHDSFGDKNTNDGENQFNRDVASLLPNDNGNSQSVDSHTGTVSSQCDNGSIGNNPDDTGNVTEKESGCQVKGALLWLLHSAGACMSLSFWFLAKSW